MTHQPIRVSSCRFLICHEHDAALKSFANLIRDQKITHYFFKKSGESIVDRIEATKPDIVYIDYDNQPDNCLNAINRLRFGYAGKNPYLPVILSSTHRNPVHINPALNSGFDMLVPAPISREMLSKQIIATIEHRPPYIVSHDYIGPQRSTQEKHEGTEEREKSTVVVPNVFALKARGKKISNSQVKSMIQETNNEINQIILKERSFGIRDLIQNMHYLLQEQSSSREARELNLKRLHDSILVSKERIKGTPYTHIIQMYDSLISLIRSLQDHKLPFGPRQLSIMKHTSIGITQAFSEDDSIRAQASAITDTVKQYSQS